MLENDRPHVLREMIYVCRPGGILSIPGVYSGLVDKIPMGQAMNKGLTFRMGQTHVHPTLPTLLEYIQTGALKPEVIISHRMALAEAAERDIAGYLRYASTPDQLQVTTPMSVTNTTDIAGYSMAVESYEYSKMAMNHLSFESGAGLSLMYGPRLNPGNQSGAAALGLLRLRIQALGDVDELNSQLGVLLRETLPAALREELAYHEHRYHVLEYPLIGKRRYLEMRQELAALERGVVQGYGYPLWGIDDFGWAKLTKRLGDKDLAAASGLRSAATGPGAAPRGATSSPPATSRGATATAPTPAVRASPSSGRSTNEPRHRRDGQRRADRDCRAGPDRTGPGHDARGAGRCRDPDGDPHGHQHDAA